MTLPSIVMRRGLARDRRKSGANHACRTAPFQPPPAALIHSEMRCTTVPSMPR